MAHRNELEVIEMKEISPDFGPAQIEVRAYYPGRKATFTVMGDDSKSALEKARSKFNYQLRQRAAYYAEQYLPDDDKYHLEQSRKRRWDVN
jgi:hypothetical protein